MTTIKELKEKIKDLPDDMEVGGSGHFGEFLECWDITVTTTKKNLSSNEHKKILCISIENPGEEPD